MFIKKLFIIIIIFSITLWLGSSFISPVLAEEEVILEEEAILEEEQTCQPTEEICDGIDNDCDGQTDEELTQQCGTTDIGTCEYGIQACQAGVWGDCIGAIEPGEEICDSLDNDCDGQIDEDGVCDEPLEFQEPEQSFEPEEPVYNPPQEPEQPQELEPSEPEEPTFDPATAPSKVTIRVLMPNGSPPPFPVFVTFVGVGNKNFGGKIDANGELTVTMPSGRYYTELMIINTEYIQGEDGPSFFLEANEERDFGAIRLISKSEQNKRGQSLEDQTLEANILSEVGDSKGMGKILLLILKLLMKILEEVRAIASQLVGR